MTPRSRPVRNKGSESSLLKSSVSILMLNCVGEMLSNSRRIGEQERSPVVLTLVNTDCQSPALCLVLFPNLGGGVNIINEKKKEPKKTVETTYLGAQCGRGH